MTPLEKFLAEGGQIQQVEAGKRSMSEADIYRRVRGEPILSDDEPTETEFSRLDKLTGATMSDRELLAMRERQLIEE